MIFEELKAAAASEWRDYTEHAFVAQLADGTLPLPVFQDYLVQDYLFLVQFARANALAAFKSRTLSDIKDAQAAMAAIVGETDLHRELTARWGIAPEALDAAGEKQATVAYTRYVLDTGMAGDLLDLHVALAPCVIGYAEIGAALAPTLQGRPDHPYREWIETYAADDYQTSARAAIDKLDALAGRLSPRRRAELEHVFTTATRLEADFWHQALDGVS